MCGIYNRPPQRKSSKKKRVHLAEPSTFERRAYSAIHALPDDLRLADTEWHTDVHLLPIAYGVNHSSVDIYVPRHRLCIMVDGQHHFPAAKKPRRETSVSKARRKQQVIDHAFNELALSEGYSVLRLHYNQQTRFKDAVFSMLLACKQGRARNKIEFTKSFSIEYRLKYEKYLLTPVEIDKDDE